MSDQNELPGMSTTPESLVEQEILDPSGDKWPPLLAELVTVAEAALLKSGLPANEAAELAIATVLAVGDFIGGKLVYIPRGDRLRTALKHARAWRMWKGNNIGEIACYLDVSEVRAYAIVAQQRALHREKLQGKLL
ncbi:MAG TPA: Mor transcription activator family protein [Pseudoxanthomonas sp.]|nr:Mor transcription activator family protein [Pseudoxanthomonas sp.]